MKKITKSVLLRTLLLNMVIVAVITGFLFPLSGKIRAVMINQEVRARQTVLQTGLENFSTQLRYLEQSIVAPTQYFSRLSSQGDIKAKDAYSILLAQRYLGAVKNSTNYVLDIIVTFDKNDIILT